MPVTLKSEKQIALMREAGNRLARVHGELKKMIRPGISTLDIDRLGDELIREQGCTPAFRNYQGYPSAICVSVNNEVVHGIPRRERIIKEGDIVSLDAGVVYKGYYSDAARTWGVGRISENASRLIEVTRESFFAGISHAKDGAYLRDISAAIENYVRKNGFCVVRDLAGHGIGTDLHEEPDVYNYKTRDRGIRLKAGMTLAVEPMVSAGSEEVTLLDDGWTYITKDHSLSAHYENTILITKSGCEILSLR